MSYQRGARERPLLPPPRTFSVSMADVHTRTGSRGAPWLRLAAETALVLALLCLAIANIVARATWSEVGDGILWRAADNAVVAQVVTPDSPGARAGLQPGDVLLGINLRPVQSVDDLVRIFHAADQGTGVTYQIFREGHSQIFDVTLEPLPSGPRGLY